MRTFRLDDQEIPFEPGDTILRAAHRVGIDIPHYCWHPGLSVAANCRMCLVELLPPPGRAPLMLDVLEYDAERREYSKVRKPKLVPACQQLVSEGMEVKSQSSAHAERAHAAVQEFLLLNHPVDCPICDQAGECRLQDYWLSTSRSKKRMLDEPVHKPKAVVFGPTIVYDAERCIVCTRCIRVCNELAKDPVLSLRERGNLTEVVLAPGRQLDHKYTLMTEYVCPVGALTARDFRFKARVWFLRSAPSVCVGCATGCNCTIDYDPRHQRVYRYRPRENQKVNKYWMCDEGMLDYQRIHSGRVLEARRRGNASKFEAALDEAAALLRAATPDSLAVVLSAQQSSEDNFALVHLGKALGARFWFQSGKRPGEGDDVLISPDKNPNSCGVAQLCAQIEVGSFGELCSAVEAGKIRNVLMLGSDASEPERATALAAPDTQVVVLASHYADVADHADVLLPICSWAETSGTFVNTSGLAQVTQAAIAPIGDAWPAWKAIVRLADKLERPLGFAGLRQLRDAMRATAAGTQQASSLTEGAGS
ncbi:MAG: (2Fe-2S)-binding protein [Polyangiaceae bacterium]|nr:(2Fe-2S)-binding protein [Polyangiaceae bacterium]